MTSPYAPGSLEVTVSGTTVTCSLVNQGSAISVSMWAFSDGYIQRVAYGDTVGPSISHAFTVYGQQSVTVTFWQNSRQITWSRTFIIKNPNDEEDELAGTTVLDVFKAKPIVIPAECTGDIAIKASITELDKLNDPPDKSTPTSSVAFSINFATITIPGNSRIVLPFNEVTTSGSTIAGCKVTDCQDIKNVANIPAFYTRGFFNIDYSFVDTEDADSGLDVVWDLWMDFPTIMTSCPWMEGNFATSSQIFKNIIRSDRSEALFPSLEVGSILNQQFTVETWNGVPPFVIREFVDEPATTTMVKRAMLAYPRFHLVAENKLADSVTLGNIIVKATWQFNPHGWFMNMRTEGDKRPKNQMLLTLPKGAEVTRNTGLDFPIYVVVDGYKRFTATRKDEIVKVYGKWNEYHASSGDIDSYYFPTFVKVEPVANMYGTDYPTCIYKSTTYPLKRDDFIRVSGDNGWMSRDTAIVIDAPSIAADDIYRNIKVSVKNGQSPDHKFATFVIETMPNDSLNFPTITKTELEANVKKLHFFNYSTNFATNIEVPRSSIDPIFYETLSKTYKEAVILESISEEPLYRINFSVNNYPKVVPIRDGQTLSFGDWLSHAADGIRSSEIFVMDGTTPNIINMQCPTKHKYMVKFDVDYKVYDNIYIATDDDFPVGFKPVTKTT